MNTIRLLLLSSGGSLLLRWTALLLIAWVIQLGLLHRHPRWRLILWRSVLLLGLVIPLQMISPFALWRISLHAASPRQSTPDHSPSSIALIARRLDLKIAQPKDVPTQVVAAEVAQSPGDFLREAGGFLLELVWITGGAVGLLRLALLQVQLSRLRRRSIRANSELLSLANTIGERLSIQRPIEVRVSDTVTSPFVCGLLNPVVILPAELLRTLAPLETAALLTHEIAHLRSNDLFWSIAWRWMATLAWLHPLAWGIPAAHNLACEEEADRIASERWENDGTYSRLLARLTLRVFALRAVETTLVINGCSQIAKRLTFLRRRRDHAWSWRNSLVSIGMVAGLLLVCCGWGISRAEAADQASPGVLKHYEDSMWKFSIDIPSRWNRFPPVSANSPYEVIRFESQEEGYHGLIVFRNPRDPKQPMGEWLDQTQKILVKGGFGNFVRGTATIGSRQVGTLDFDKPRKDGKTWSVREYFIADDTLGYVLAFGSTNRAGMFDLYDRMAQTFRIQE